MAKQIVMDATGDTRHEFDPADTPAVAEALARFEAIDRAGSPQLCAGVGNFRTHSQLRSCCQ